MKIAFVIPWYGKDIPGGAELECRRTALNLKKAGVNVEILTTCVKDFHSDWGNNYYEENTYDIEGLPVRRFAVKKRNAEAFDAINVKLMNCKMVSPSSSNAWDSPISSEDEKTYIQEMINSPTLYDYIEKTASEYDFFIFIPYMFGTTYYGSRICPEKSIIIPCLHDEAYAYMKIYRDMFLRSCALLFNAASELRLAKKLYGIRDERAYLMGIGVDSAFSCNGSRFREKYGVKDPFLLYAGRKDSTKNVPLLTDYFLCYLKGNPQELKLVLIGPGDLEMSHEKSPDLIDLGFVQSQDKYDAYDAALLLCQPSVNESFSLVIMESWLASTPVLVHSDCAVTKEHCVSSGGGLFFSSYDQFERQLDFMISNLHITELMGKAGKDYVLQNYSWEHITRRYLGLFDSLKRSSRAIRNPVINIMTASLAKGDAIGNYIKCLREILSELGYAVNIFADEGSHDVDFLPSSKYQPDERSILWFHYSIYADNLRFIREGNGFKVMDFHGVTPSFLFKGYHKKLEDLTRRGQAFLYNYVDDFNLSIVHSDYASGILKDAGYSRIVKSPLMVSDDLCNTPEDQLFARPLSRLEYLLFVGRIVPQKDILSIIRFFAELKKLRPNIALFLVGSTEIAPGYVSHVVDLIAELGLERSICLTGKIVDSSTLASFYKYAKFLIIMSEWESFCMPIVESMFFGVPVIGTNKTCVPETIGDAGILLDGLDVKGSADIVNKTWGDGDKYNELSEKARLRANLFGQNELKIRIREIIEDHFPKHRMP